MQRLDLIPCDAPLWAASGHGQTLWGHIIKSPTLANLGQSLKVDLPDGDRLFCYLKEGPSDYVVSLFHGLSGDVTSDYMQRTAMVCEALGHSVLLVNHRGAGEGKAAARRPYHSGSTGDMSQVLSVLRQRYPKKKLITVGFSLSGNILLSLLGGLRGGEKPDGAITVNAPLELGKGSLLLKSGLNRLYDLRFVLRLRQMVEDKQRLGLIEESYRIPPWATLYHFDEIYTAPASGFRDREDYYATCSSILYVDKIQTPTYLLTAADDPFIDVRDYHRAPLSRSCLLHIEKSGGHMGYLSKSQTPLGTRRWLDYYISEALQGLTHVLTAP